MLKLIVIKANMSNSRHPRRSPEALWASWTVWHPLTLPRTLENAARHRVGFLGCPEQGQELGWLIPGGPSKPAYPVILWMRC